MQLACPKCGGRDVRKSRLHGIQEKLLARLGKFPWRCRQCGTRWMGPEPGDSKYARCPVCSREELTTWSDGQTQVPFWTRVKTLLGAKRYRCNICRLNFASFRARKRAAKA